MKVYRILFIIAVCSIFGVSESFAQCGADGTQPCPKTTPKKMTSVSKPKPTTKKTTKTQTKKVAKTTTKQTCTKADNFNNKDAPSNSTATINGVKFEFVGIPSGSFCMGSNNGEDNEKPVHRVNLTRAFSMGKYEVTQAQWQAVMGNNPSYFKSCGENCPVEKVSWEDVQDFIKKLNKIGEGTYRLPTEAEWEYACRAGSTTKYFFGDSESSLENYAWYIANSRSKTYEVGTKQPNNWGLYDMYGNVAEWVQDWYGNYPRGTVTNPTGTTNGLGPVLRSGGFTGIGEYISSAERGYNDPSFRAGALGFRLVRN